MPPHREPSSRPSAMDIISQFNKLKPLKFERGADALRYEEWMQKSKNLFENTECPKNEEKTRLRIND